MNPTLLAFVVFAALVFVSAAHAQVTDSSPVRVKIKTEKAREDSFRGEVMNFTPTSITVRDRGNYSVIRTFTFSPELRRKVENKRMEYGDRVEVRYGRGSDTAVKLKGKLRKPEYPVLPQVR